MQYVSRFARTLGAALLMAAAHAPAYAQDVAAKEGPRSGQYRAIAIHANGNGSKPLIVLDRLGDDVKIEPFLSPWQFSELGNAASAEGFKGYYPPEKIVDRGRVIGFVLEPQDNGSAGRARYHFDSIRNGRAVMRIAEDSFVQSGGAGGAGGGGAGGSGGGGAGGGY